MRDRSMFPSSQHHSEKRRASLHARRGDDDGDGPFGSVHSATLSHTEGLRYVVDDTLVQWYVIR